MSQAESGTSSRWPVAAALGALGVVFGDIGTSPLYAFKECFLSGHGAPVNPFNLIGAASLIVWSLLFIVGFKYLRMILRLDNRGEGGVLALAALIRNAVPGEKNQRWFFMLGLFGAALIYADGMLTPAISVLSAVEGLKTVKPLTDAFPAITKSEHLIPLIAIVILIGLFAIQRYGTAKVGKLFGPIVLTWFAVLAITGTVSLLQTPKVLEALLPNTAIKFLVLEWQHGLPLLAAVFLAVTGGEALYADLGHFGRRPIRMAWWVVVCPALVLNYLGQAALLERQPEIMAGENASPFFHLIDPDRFPGLNLLLVILAVLATIIASQALISGAFSLTAQAIQLNCLPRLRIFHTSVTEKGQIYLPMVNWLLAIACVLLVAIFQSSEALAAAYGIAIALTMTATSVLFWAAARKIWQWSVAKAAVLSCIFLGVDLAFLSANSLKIHDGGWLPLVVASAVMFLMTTWTWGRNRSAVQFARQRIPLGDLLDQVARGTIPRVRGTAIFMTGQADAVPVPLLHNLKHNGVIHERLILLHVLTLDVAVAAKEERFEFKDLGQGFLNVILRFGFSEEPDVPQALKEGMPPEIGYHPGRTSFFLGRETIVTGKACTSKHRVRLAIFASMLRNATPASAYFKLPPNRVVELGAQVTL
ncbi:MAG: KUP/HAK/KT family potassium transporter [Luteolibacter sp.]